MSLPTLMPALVTPFTRAGKLDLKAHAFNLEHLSAQGIAGFVLGGSTGEGPLLEPGERRDLVKTARKTLGDNTHLMVGIMAESVRQALNQITESAAAGTDTVLVLGPLTMARNSLDAQRKFFTEIADKSPLPVLLYSVPRNTGYALDEKMCGELAAHQNVVGMKDSGADAVRIVRIARAAGGDFSMFNGASASVVAAVSGGIHGAITASVNYLPETMQRLVELAKASPGEAAVLQDRVTSTTGKIEAAGIGGIKAAAREAGLRPGYPRAPFTPASRAFARSISQLVDH